MPGSRKQTRLALLACALVATTALAIPVQQPLAPIDTDSGKVAGMVLPSGVKAWHGVPFAQAPVGDLRWQRPQPIRWQGVWNADRTMPECMQVLRPHKINHYFGEEATSEDCLYMNIWAPAKATARSKLPVIVFIYGGGGTIGSSGIPTYGGEAVARRGDAVFVNFNYRVGVLGFLAHPELSKEQGGSSGNYSYLDQNAALRWVQANIAKFGGDPSRVVIMGQSAGASSVTQQVFSPLSKGLFSGAVMSSGCSWGSATGISLAEGEKNGLDIQRRLGAASLAEMRDIPADRIIDLQAEFQLGLSTGGFRATGIIDGHFMPKTQAEILKAREHNDVPIIASFNRDEASGPLMNAASVDEYRGIARRLYGDQADAFLALYPVNTTQDIRRVGGQVAREGGFGNNARNCAQLQAQHSRSSAYLDMFSKRHSYAPGVVIADQDVSTVGAYHTADIPFFFGTLDVFNSLRKTREWTTADRELSTLMMDSLVAFAATGNPATKAAAWPAWSPTQEVMVEFGGAGGPAQVVPLNTRGLDWLKANPARPLPVAAPARAPGPRD